MCLIIDASEARVGSRLPEKIAQQAEVSSFLEEMTGADILVSPLSAPAKTKTLLAAHCNAGILIQRKTGQDLIRSVFDGRLIDSLARMQEWSGLPTLAFVGVIERGQNNTLMLDGEPQSAMTYSATNKALEMYQLRGGHVMCLSDDEAFVEWVCGLPNILSELKSKPVKLIRHQALSDSPLLNALANLWTGDGRLGVARANKVIEHLTARLRDTEQINYLNALSVLTDLTTPLQGSSKKTRQGIRQWMGLEQTPVEGGSNLVTDVISVAFTVQKDTWEANDEQDLEGE